jgi:hypothetical protein
MGVLMGGGPGVRPSGGLSMPAGRLRTVMMVSARSKKASMTVVRRS